MKTNYIATILFWLIYVSANAQLLPDYEFPVIFHSASGNSDTVYLGLSSNAISGISPNLDVIDTSDFNNLVDARIYDEEVQNQIGSNCYNLKKFYQPYPNLAEANGFSLTYFVVFKMDSFNNDHDAWSNNHCETNNPNFSYISIDPQSLYDFEFLNDQGLSYSFQTQIVAYNFNLGGIDYYDIYSTPETCFNVSYPFNYSDGICNDVDNGLVVSIRLSFGNKFFINLEHQHSYSDYTINYINDNYEIFTNKNDIISLFDLSGKLILNETITAQELTTINTNQFTKGVYILKFQNSSLTKKIIKL